MTDIVIYGTGNGARNIQSILNVCGCRIMAYVDSNQLKWGNVFCGVEVHNPEFLYDNDYPVVIASTWEEEIREKLTKMGLAHRIVIKEEYMIQYVENNALQYKTLTQSPQKKDENTEITILFGLELGLYNGGIESWAYTIADELRTRGYRIKFITSNVSRPAPPRFENDTYYLSLRSEKCGEGLEELIQVIMENSPCVMIDSWQSYIMFAMAIIRKCNPGAVNKFFEVVHNDLPRLFRAVHMFEPYIDCCMAVSETLIDKLKVQFDLKAYKIKYKESPVLFCDIEREYRTNREKPLRIGYGARLERSQKRADLLIPLAEMLRKKNIPFKLQISGEGTLKTFLLERIEEKQLSDCVELVGLLPREQMPVFWSSQDIFINMSEYEGVGLSMLEAMGYGCVPVVMEVAGSREFVEGGMGYVCKNGSLEEMADRIQFIASNRERMAEMGAKSQQSIRTKCDVRMYVDNLLQLANLQ